MKAITSILIAAMLPMAAIAAPALASPPDPAAPVRQFLDGFNTGDTKSAFAAYAPGEIAIIDEFAPNHWIGTKAPQIWAADYDSHAKATGVTEGIVKYYKPTRIEVAGKAGYVVMPTLYTYKEKGKPMAEEGSITASVVLTGAGWKMHAWTWSGVKPHAAK